MDVKTTTAAKQSVILQSTNNFCERDPHADAPAFPITFHGFDFVNPVRNPGTLRFVGAMQVRHWIAHAQLRPFAHTPQSTQIQIELTSNNGKHWLAAAAINCWLLIMNGTSTSAWGQRLAIQH